MLRNNHRVNGVVLDLDGVLWVADTLRIGASTFIEHLRREEIPFCLLTNDCSVSKAERQDRLTRAGLTLRADQLVTAADVTRDWLKNQAVQTLMYLGAPSVLPDIAEGVRVCDTGPVNAVVVGDLFVCFDRQSLDKAVKSVTDGATLVAMQSNLRWSGGINWHVDNGFWIAGLEHVTGQKAIVMGKPSPYAYLAAVDRLGLIAHASMRIVFVSDDIAIDLKGAKDIGLITVYFGSEPVSMPWVDHSVRDIDALASLLAGLGA